MKRVSLFILSLLIPVIVFAQVFEIPVCEKQCTEQIIAHTGYIVSYNQDRLIP